MRAHERTPRHSALRVHLELLADRLIVHARLDVILQNVGEGDEQLVDALVLDQLRKESLRLAALVLAEQLPNLVQSDLALEVQVHVLQQVPSEFFHVDSSFLGRSNADRTQKKRGDRPRCLHVSGRSRGYWDIGLYAPSPSECKGISGTFTAL